MLHDSKPGETLVYAMLDIQVRYDVSVKERQQMISTYQALKQL